MNQLENIKATGALKLQVFGPDNQLKEEHDFKNLVVDTGLNYIVSRMKDTTQGAMSHMAIGSTNTAAAANQTALLGELGRVALTSTTVSANTVTYTATFGAGVGTGAVVEAAILNASSSGSMLCRTVFPVVNKQADDSIAITWTVTIS